VAEALRAPARQIADNAGEDGEVVVARILEKSGAWGYNAATGEYGDLIKFGILDPAKVSRTALLNAASVAGLALTTDVLLTELEQRQGESSAPIAGAVAYAIAAGRLLLSCDQPVSRGCIIPAISLGGP